MRLLYSDLIMLVHILGMHLHIDLHGRQNLFQVALTNNTLYEPLLKRFFTF